MLTPVMPKPLTYGARSSGAVVFKAVVMLAAATVGGRLITVMFSVACAAAV